MQKFLLLRHIQAQWIRIRSQMHIAVKRGKGSGGASFQKLALRTSGPGREFLERGLPELSTAILEDGA